MRFSRYRLKGNPSIMGDRKSTRLQPQASGGAINDGSCEPIRNGREPICSDSYRPRFQFATSRDRVPVLLSHVGSPKKLRSTSGSVSQESQSVGMEMPLDRGQGADTTHDKILPVHGFSQT